nr:MAG TPA: hypothetical protein [Caudoviricetes sp.]
MKYVLASVRAVKENYHVVLRPPGLDSRCHTST